jgi:hypothetical protein
MSAQGVANVGDPDIQMAAAAIERALRPAQGDVSAAVETQLQNALYAVRAASADRQLLDRLEDVAATVRLMAEAKRQGRTNLYMSQLLRLRRRVPPSPRLGAHGPLC